MFRNMEYVYAVYREGSFSAAAAKLYVSQPCLSAMVKKTEEKLGVPLFDRKAKPLRLTEYGVRYLAYLEKIREMEGDLEQYLNDVRGLRTGHIAVGVNNVLASYVLPRMIYRFQERYPGVQVEMTEGNISYLKKALVEGSIDLVLDNCRMSPELFEKVPLGQEHLLLAIHRSLRDKSHPQGSRLSYEEVLKGVHLKRKIPPVFVREFARVPFIALREGNDTRERMDLAFSREGVSPRICMEVDQLATAYNIAENRLGATLVSDTLIRAASGNPEMDFYPLEESAATRPIYLYYKKERYVSFAMKRFLEVAEETFLQGEGREGLTEQGERDILHKDSKKGN